MERTDLTSNELKIELSAIYNKTIMAIINIIHQTGSHSYSMNGYWMSSEVPFELPSKISVGPNLIHLSNSMKFGQLNKIGTYRNGSVSKKRIDEV